jgi:membrane protease YdiL (CAAX protease family)
MNSYHLLQILLIFVLPIILLFFNIIKKRFRLLLLFLISLLAIGIVFVEKISANNLGLRIDNFRISIFPYAIFTIVALIAIFLFAFLLRRKPDVNWKKDIHFLYLFIPISALQEFLYRGFLFFKLESVSTNIFWVILANTVLFTLLHVIYRDIKVNIPFAFVAGLGFSLMYYYYPNLILISISHMILNYFAVFFGFFSDNNNLENHQNRSIIKL